MSDGGKNTEGNTTPVALGNKDSSHSLNRFHTEGTVDPEELENIKDTMKPLLGSLRAHIESGEYSLLVSDETSGRIPTLIIRNFINNIYRNQNRPSIDALFYLGLYDPLGRKLEDREEFARRIEFYKKKYPGKKALIVTERIAGGWNVGNISMQLTEEGMPHDVATLRMDTSPDEINRNRKLSGYPPIAPNGKIFYGAIGVGINLGPVEFDAIKGVRHDLKEVTEGEVKKKQHAVSVVRNPEYRQITVGARKKVREISTQLTPEVRQPLFKEIISRLIGKIRH